MTDNDITDDLPHWLRNVEPAVSIKVKKRNGQSVIESVDDRKKRDESFARLAESLDDDELRELAELRKLLRQGE